MYGLVNQAIKDLVCVRFGEQLWIEICDEIQIPSGNFISMQYYPDETTYNLVGAASKKLSMPADLILVEFGKHWVLFTAQEGYGGLMDLFGSDLRSCLSNLNNLHARMGMTMPQLSPPRFKFQVLDSSRFRVEYYSKRTGLAPMVQGLLEGLATRYKTKVLIQYSLENEVHVFDINILENVE